MYRPVFIEGEDVLPVDAPGFATLDEARDWIATRQFGVLMSADEYAHARLDDDGCPHARPEVL